MTKELLEQESHPTDDQIRHYLSGHLCRCASYPEIVKAVNSVACIDGDSSGPAGNRQSAE
jgi:aerobic-type carbon monoxide dehydrogenase small subunit (CoxS/CutS family)